MSDSKELPQEPEVAGLGEESSVAEDSQSGEPSIKKRPPRVRKYIVPLMTGVLLLVLLIQFRTVILPFIFACLIVYLMEPIVSRMERTPERTRGLPRWISVLLVYVLFLSLVGGLVALIAPRFVVEVLKLGETVPEVVREFRRDQLPELDARLGSFIDTYVPVHAKQDHVQVASARLLESRVKAAENAVVFGMAYLVTDKAVSHEQRIVSIEEENALGETQVRLEGAVIWSEVKLPEWSSEKSLDGGSWRFALMDSPAFRLVPDRNGAIEVYLNSVELEIEEVDGKWKVRRTDDEELPRREYRYIGVSLQENLDNTLEEFIESSTSRLGDFINLARTLLISVIQGFVGIVLTLMVAAFISIDLVRVKKFFRGVIPEEGRQGYDRFLEMADRGLSGVIRGQLMICVVNGVLTYIGLAIIGVKFSLLLAVVAGILSVIPVFGTILSTVPIVVIGLTDGLTTGLLALGWILLIHFVEANILNPKIIGNTAHIHPVIVIFALLAGESAYGLVGALLAVPTASLVLTVFNFVRLRGWKPDGNPAST